MYGTAVTAFALGKGFIVSKGASACGNRAIAPDGAAAGGGGVVVESAAYDSGRIAFVHNAAATLVTLAVADGAVCDVERGTADVIDAAAVDAFAVSDGDVVEGRRSFVHDASGRVDAVIVVAAVPAAAERTACEGEVAARSHDDDAAHFGGAAEVASQGVPAEVDGNRFASWDG